MPGCIWQLWDCPARGFREYYCPSAVRHVAWLFSWHLFLALVLWAGTYALMYNYPLTRDEHMVVFDMQIFESGRLAKPLAPEWRPYAEVLVPAFLLDVLGNALLVSAIVNPWNPVRQREIWLDPAHLRLRQPDQITHGSASLRRHWKRSCAQHNQPITQAI